MADSLRELAGVQEVLVPYTDFAPGELAQQLNELVIANTELLTMRGITGVIRRYSDLDSAEQKVRKGQAEQAKLGHYAVVNAAGNVRGSASIIPNLSLKKQHIPLPPMLAIGPLVDTYPGAGPNIHAWTDKEDLELLSDAYSDLIYRTNGWWKRSTSPKVWTVEPTRSPDGIHQAIQYGGLQIVATRRFDDGESRRQIPPRSTLYARLYSEWLSAHGKQLELKTGAKSFLTALDEANGEMMSRNPNSY